MYFVKSLRSLTVTFDLLTGNFRIIKYNRARKVNHKVFYANSFYSLGQALLEFYKPETKMESSDLLPMYLSEFNTEKFHTALQSALTINETSLEGVPEFVVKNVINQFVFRFIELRKIKVPNNFMRFLLYYYPTERYLKKNDRKLLAAVLDRFGIKSKVTVESEQAADIVNMFYDHFRMLKKVRKYYPDMKLTSITYSTFLTSHGEVAKIERSIQRGWSVHYLFDVDVVREIEAPIEIERLPEIQVTDNPYSNPFVMIMREVYQPVILKSTEDYLEEGAVMGHCVWRI